MKRILFILPSLTVGGLEKVQVTLANALVNRGYDVTIMILQPERELGFELDEKVHLIYKGPKCHFMQKFPYIRHKFYDDGMWETRASAQTLYKYYVGKEKYDIEIGFFRGLAVKIISGSTNRDSVKLAWVHNDFRKCAGIKNNFRHLNDVKKAYGQFDRIICVSNEARKSFVEVIGLCNKVATVYNILPNDEIKSRCLLPIPLEKKQFTIVSVGRLTEAKGYDRLLSVVKRLIDEGYQFELWLVGSGEEEQKLKEYVIKYKLQSVRFLGKQSNPYCYMRQADLYVCSSRYEGYNLTVAEALLCGTPVISTECAGPCEILANGTYGMIVENSKEGLYYGIKTILEQPELLEMYRIKTGEREEFFDKDRILGEIEDYFSTRNKM